MSRSISTLMLALLITSTVFADPVAYWTAVPNAAGNGDPYEPQFSSVTHHTFDLMFDNEATRNIFKRCHLTMYAGNNGAIFVEVVDNESIDRYTIFDRCLFSNPSATGMSQAFAIPTEEAGADPSFRSTKE